MKKLVSYPAIFHEEDNGYFVEFPDLEGCFTQGENLTEATVKAHEVLGYYLEDFDLNSLPESSDIKSLTTTDDAFASIIAIDLIEHRKKYNNKAVKKTLTIPEWLNEAAQNENINFSQLLQEAIMEKLDLS